MASVNKNENLDDCIRNVNNETFRHLVQGGNLNTLQEAQQPKQTVSISEKNRKYSVDSWMLKRGLIKGSAARRASCSPSMILPRIPSTSNNLPTTSQGKRRHSHAGIPSVPSVISCGMGSKLSSKYRRRSMVSLAADGLTAPCTTLGPMDLRSMFASQAALQELDEGRDSCHGTPVLSPPETEIFPEAGKKLGHGLEAKRSIQSVPDQSVNCENSDFDSAWRGLPKSASFMSLEQVEMEAQKKKTRSASFCLPSVSRQRKTAVSYSSENYPIVECPTVSAEDYRVASQEDSQFLGQDFGEKINSCDSSSTTSSLIDDEFTEDPVNLFLMDTSFHLILLHPAPQQSCISALMVWILISLIFFISYSEIATHYKIYARGEFL